MKNYYKPTPVFWRKIGDACLSVSTLLSGGTLLSMEQFSEIFTKSQMITFALVVMVFGSVGKFLTNFFSE